MKPLGRALLGLVVVIVLAVLGAVVLRALYSRPRLASAPRQGAGSFPVVGRATLAA
ncbi:MAG: hypothetical protein U5Q44_11720 [Dehalococcoidia bacterium]|nr:hypothetical protein [Dehalococcoidia bacterium]